MFAPKNACGYSMYGTQTSKAPGRGRKVLFRDPRARLRTHLMRLDELRERGREFIRTTRRRWIA